MMTPTEMEDVLRNLDRRVETIEQILPTLATKEDLKVFATKVELQDFWRHMDVGFEHLESKIDTLVEHLADISLRLPPRS